jgi:hypothetical protein
VPESTLPCLEPKILNVRNQAATRILHSLILPFSCKDLARSAS